MSLITHNDNRRTIYDFAQGNFKSLKAVVIKERVAVGDHYHNNKDEVFFLAVGCIEELTIGEKVVKDIFPPYLIEVTRGLYHKFICTPGTIIFGAATEEFDKNDEIKLS